MRGERARSDRERGSGGPALAGGVGALVACCAVHFLIIAGVIAGMGGLAFGGLVLGIGLAIAAVTWLVAWRLRKRSVCRLPTDRPEARRAEAHRTGR